MSARKIESGKGEAKLQMTSMIDVVFLLLAFFVVTYKTPEVEGDFNIRMPVEAQSTSVSDDFDDASPVVVTLSADANGALTGIRFGEAKVKDMAALRVATFQYANANGLTFQEAFSGATPEFRADVEIELDCDPQLRYGFAMQAITAVTGYLNSEDQLVKMVEKVTFSPPK